MRNILLTFFIACLASAAHATTIDFEEFASGAGNGAITTQGYKLTSTGGFPDTYYLGTLYTSTRSYAWCPDCTLTLEHANGELFSISSANIYAPPSYDGYLYPQISITGYLSGGGTVQTSKGSGTSPTFGSEWTNLQRIEFGNGNQQLTGQAIDNIVVSTVPVPPAIWLFASALFGLMNLRRLQWPAQ